MRDLCAATFEPSQRRDRADTHTCGRVAGHVEAWHRCPLCGSLWANRRVIPVSDDEAAHQEIEAEMASEADGDVNR